MTQVACAEPHESGPLMRLKVGIALSAAVFATIFVAQGVKADPFGIPSSSTGRIADNHDHDWCWSTGFTLTDMRTKATDAHAYLHSSTNFGGGSFQTCDSGTDVKWMAQNTTAWKGSTVCVTLNGSKCDVHTSSITTNTTTLPVASRRHTICHELGHSTGASHHAESGWGCLTNGGSSETYVTHTRNHMNVLVTSSS